MKKEIIKLYSAPEMVSLGNRLGKRLIGGEVIALYGELGSGKTTLISGMIKQFLPKKRVLSPSFTLIRHYSFPHQTIKHFYHMDLYRLKYINDVLSLGVWDIIGRNDTVVAIEWPDLIESLLPEKRIELKLSIINDYRVVEEIYG